VNSQDVSWARAVVSRTVSASSVPRCGAHADAIGDQQRVRGNEAEEDRQQDADRFLGAAQVHPQQYQNQRQRAAQLPGLEGQRQQRKQRVDAAGHGDGDGQHVVDRQRGPRNQAGVTSEQHGSDAVATAAGREQLDHLVVSKGDHEDGDGRGQCKVQPEVGMGAERLEGFFRPVGRGRKAIRTEAHPGEKGGQGEGVPCAGGERIERAAEEDGAQSGMHEDAVWWNRQPR